MIRFSLFRTLSIRCSHYIISSALIILLALGSFHYQNSQVYVVSAGGHELGVVEDAREIDFFVEELTEEYSTLYSMDLEFTKKITMIKELRPDCEPDPETVRKRIRQIGSFLADAYMIKVDGKPFVPVASEDDLDQVVEALKDEYTGECERATAKVLDFIVAENLDLQEIRVEPEQVFTAAEAASLLKANGSKAPLIMADAGLFEDRLNDLHLPSILEHEFNSAPSHLEVVVPGSEPVTEKTPVEDITVSVKSLEEVTEIEPIPYSTEYIYDDDMLISEKEVKEVGSDGEKEIVYQVERENGIEIERKVISEKVIKEPEPQVEIKGLKEPPSIGTGQFVWPVRGKGVVYNGFSSRHTGIDIHIEQGTSVLAADDGVVTFDGYGDTQGKYLILRHGKYWTLYLHNSEHLVSKGDRVSRGQPIAKVGATGRAFGSHLHFEVRVDDGSREWNSYYQHRPVDPLQFYNR